MLLGVEQKWAKTIRGTVRYLERPGEGTVLLFLHGLGDCADQCEPIAAHLPENWRLLAMDQRGHGGSFKPAEDYSPFDFAADIKAFLDELDLWSVHLFGHSMGGRNALVLAAQHPERVRGLILATSVRRRTSRTSSKPACSSSDYPSPLRTTTRPGNTDVSESRTTPKSSSTC
jgi:pimeloyl-ACP methyl ester carboxylesterase